MLRGNLMIFACLIQLAAGETSRNGLFLNRLETTEAAVQQQTKAQPRMNAKEAHNEQQTKKHSVFQSDKGLKSFMRQMMDDGDDDEAQAIQRLGSHGRDSNDGGSFLQESKTEDAYMKDSEEGLSAALGPRWNSAELEHTADRNTRAFLQGIGNPSALSGLNGMMETMMHMR